MIQHITRLLQINFDVFFSRKNLIIWMKSLKGFMDEICFKENLTKGMGGEEKFTRSENEFAPREEIWKSCRVNKLVQKKAVNME